MNFKNKIKPLISALLSASMLMSAVPVITHAAQSNEYVDPADVWISSVGRTNELDVNATITYETALCGVCNKHTTVMTYRVPEYTRTGETALNRGVYYSDGTCFDGTTHGNLDDGTPGVDAKFTGCHWTKCVCQNCGTLNAADGTSSYSFNKNVYSLNSCDTNFFLDFDNTAHEPYNSREHKTTLKAGKYCQFCKGTKESAKIEYDSHDFDETVSAELSNQRFHLQGECSECGYKKNEYAAAKSVVQSYYGKVDGSAHTVTVSDLSDSGVHTSIRYGTEADNCNKTSAPNYTEEGYYPVYYEIDYSYDGENMTENGVSYVWLLSDNSGNTSTNSAHTHDYRYLETIRPTCTELGYDRFQCGECGALQKTNYVPSTGHDYETITVREASCQQGGLELHMCKKCGAHHTENTSMVNHRYQNNIVAAACTTNGYTEHACVDCGYKYVTDLTPLARHDYREKVTAPGCTTRGFTTYTCADCGTAYISDYTNPTGHEWDNGRVVTNSTCSGEGVMEYKCKHCDEKMIQAISAIGHNPGPTATCTEPQTCQTCDAVLELPTGHHYSESVTAPTCSAMGFTTYTCHDCGASYIGNYTDKTEHHYTSAVTPATCTALGYTTYTCSECGDEYKSDYVDKKPHAYSSVVTPATCTQMGFTTYTCPDCGDSYVSDYTDVLEHNYTKQVIAPTCTEQGYTIYTCPDCGKEYIGDEKESIAHSFKAVVTAPTCTEMGYTTYTCEDCSYSYVADYRDAKGHSYSQSVTAPTCTKMGYTTHTCSDCSDSHISDYVEALGHKWSGWIIDTPATIEHVGSKHIECQTCGETLTTVEIPRLTDSDNSDEDGHSKVGDFSVLITDKDGKPVFDSEISIDKLNNLTIKLPDGRLLSADDKTTVTVTRTETQTPVQGIKIFIADHMNNAATGQTDANGQLNVPNSQSSTGDTTGTITDNTTTFVVIATDKTGALIPNCDVEVGDNYSINVKLPDDTAFDNSNRITVTVVTELGEPVKNLRVQILGDGDHIENGYTNIKGQVTMPMSNSAVTDADGSANVGEIASDKIFDYIVKVNNEKELIENAVVTLIAKDETIFVCLPEGKVIDYYNRTSVKILKADGTPVEGWKVSVYNKDGSGIRTELTDETGIVIVPPLSEAPIAKPTPTPNPDAEATPLPGVETTPTPTPTPTPSTTDTPDTPTPTPTPQEKPDTPSGTPTPVPDLGEGALVQNKDHKYRVFVWDNFGAITEFGLVKLQEDGNLIIELPENKLLDAENRTNIKVLNDNDKSAVKAISVTVSDKTGATASDITNSYGIAVVPVSDTDITDIKGNAQVKDNNGNLYNVNVSTDNKGAVEGAAIRIADGKIYAVLPDGTVISYKDRTTVTVSDRDNIPVTDIPVNVKDNNGGDRTENTDKNGAAVVPPRNEYETDDKGDTGDIVIPVPTPEPTPTPDPDATPKPEQTPDPNATPTPEPTPTPKPISQMNVKVEDERGVIENAIVTIGENKEVCIMLPDGKVLDKENRISVTVTDQDNEPVAGLEVTVSDKTGKSAVDTTNKFGIAIVPVTESDTSDDKGGIIKDEAMRYTVTVENNDGSVSGSAISIDDGKISVVLPETHTLITSNQTKVTVVDKDAQPVKGISVTVTDKNNKTATQSTNASGQITVPVKTSGGGGGGGSSSGGGGGYVAPVTNIKVVDKDGKSVKVSKSTDKDGNITLTLPNDKTLDNNYYTITVTDRNGKGKADVSVTVKDKKTSVSGMTDSNGSLVLPASEHKAYIVGYPDGKFAPDGNMSRAEASAIFARLIAEEKGEKITGKTSFTDVKSDAWYYSYISYLEKYDILKGYTDKTFRPDAPVTRAEFVAISVRYYKLFNEVKDVDNTTKYSDVNSNYWAVKDISIAKSIGWLNGYADGTFRGDNNITRAEAVTVINRATGRKADSKYVNENFTKLNRFTDITDNKQWFFMDVMEAANDHKAVTGSDGEFWGK